MTREKALADVVKKLEAWADQLDKTPSPVEAQHVRACALLVRDALALPADAPVRASTPTLTLTEVGEGLGWTSDKTGVYIPWDDFPKVADRLNAFLIVQTTKIFPAAPAKGDRLWITPTGKYEDGQFWIVRDREWNTVHGDCRLYLRCQKEA